MPDAADPLNRTGDSAPRATDELSAAASSP
jgi:hypothetical protein